MKKLLSVLLTLALLASALFVLSACGGNDEKTIKVGASPTPHAEILASAKQILADKGYTLEIVEYDDYVLPNVALADGTLDANYFQHVPYLNSYNASNGTDLVSVAAIHYEPFGLYGNGVDSVEAIPDGATIFIPADDSNETRALYLLKEQGLITLKEGTSALTGVTTKDIADNGGYDIQPVEASTVYAQLTNAGEGTVAVINGNYALSAGLKIKDALAVESASGEAASLYANVIAARPDNKDSDKIKALVEALTTATVAEYIDGHYNGAVVSMTKK